MLASRRATACLAVWRLRTEVEVRATRSSETPCPNMQETCRMSALRATACGFSTLVFARLPLPQPLDCTGAASGGREHAEPPAPPTTVPASPDHHPPHPGAP